MHLYMTNRDIQAIVQISIDPRFEIKDFSKSCGMNGQSWENMNDFIKSAMT